MVTYIRIDKGTYPVDGYETIKANPETIVINEGKEDESLIVPEKVVGYFPIASISRDDFEARGFDASKLSNEDMERIAGKMEETYVNETLWIDIDYWGEVYKCQKK